jgi:hypothetical protein
LAGRDEVVQMRWTEGPRAATYPSPWVSPRPQAGEDIKMACFKDKYALTDRENVFLAKKFWSENIYCGMRLENRNVTFPETETILQGVNVPNVSLDDIVAILNMRDAWKHLLSTITANIDIDYICKINGLVSRNESLEWGVLRTGQVGISGTSYVPPLPVLATVGEELSSLLASPASATEKALRLFLWGARSQLFWDGNKRTSLLLANKNLISNGCGILIIKDTNMEQFSLLLTDFYNTNKEDTILTFLYENAIKGIDYPA